MAVLNIVSYICSLVFHSTPLLTMLEFMFYFGWLKVAEQLINPFGYTKLR